MLKPNKKPSLFPDSWIVLLTRLSKEEIIMYKREGDDDDDNDDDDGYVPILTPPPPPPAPVIDDIEVITLSDSDEEDPIRVLQIIKKEREKIQFALSESVSPIIENAILKYSIQKSSVLSDIETECDKRKVSVCESEPSETADRTVLQHFSSDKSEIEVLNNVETERNVAICGIPTSPSNNTDVADPQEVDEDDIKAASQCLDDLEEFLILNQLKRFPTPENINAVQPDSTTIVPSALSSEGCVGNNLHCDNASNSSSRISHIKLENVSDIDSSFYPNDNSEVKDDHEGELIIDEDRLNTPLNIDNQTNLEEIKCIHSEGPSITTTTMSPMPLKKRKRRVKLAALRTEINESDVDASLRLCITMIYNQLIAMQKYLENHYPADDDETLSKMYLTLKTIAKSCAPVILEAYSTFSGEGNSIFQRIGVRISNSMAEQILNLCKLAAKESAPEAVTNTDFEERPITGSNAPDLQNERESSAFNPVTASSSQEATCDDGKRQANEELRNNCNDKVPNISQSIQPTAPEPSFQPVVAPPPSVNMKKKRGRKKSTQPPKVCDNPFDEQYSMREENRKRYVRARPPVNQQMSPLSANTFPAEYQSQQHFADHMGSQTVAFSMPPNSAQANVNWIDGLEKRFGPFPPASARRLNTTQRRRNTTSPSNYNPYQARSEISPNANYTSRSEVDMAQYRQCVQFQQQQHNMGPQMPVVPHPQYSVSSGNIQPPVQARHSYSNFSAPPQASGGCHSQGERFYPPYPHQQHPLPNSEMSPSNNTAWMGYQAMNGLQTGGQAKRIHRYLDQVWPYQHPSDNTVQPHAAQTSSLYLQQQQQHPLTPSLPSQVNLEVSKLKEGLTSQNRSSPHRLPCNSWENCRACTQNYKQAMEAHINENLRKGYPPSMVKQNPHYPMKFFNQIQPPYFAPTSPVSPAQEEASSTVQQSSPKQSIVCPELKKVIPNEKPPLMHQPPKQFSANSTEVTHMNSLPAQDQLEPINYVISDPITSHSAPKSVDANQKSNPSPDQNSHEKLRQMMNNRLTASRATTSYQSLLGLSCNGVFANGKQTPSQTQQQPLVSESLIAANNGPGISQATTSLSESWMHNEVIVTRGAYNHVQSQQAGSMQIQQRTSSSVSLSEAENEPTTMRAITNSQSLPWGDTEPGTNKHNPSTNDQQASSMNIQRQTPTSASLSQMNNGSTTICLHGWQCSGAVEVDPVHKQVRNQQGLTNFLHPCSMKIQQQTPSPGSLSGTNNRSNTVCPPALQQNGAVDVDQVHRQVQNQQDLTNFLHPSSMKVQQQTPSPGSLSGANNGSTTVCPPALQQNGAVDVDQVHRQVQNQQALNNVQQPSSTKIQQKTPSSRSTTITQRLRGIKRNGAVSVNRVRKQIQNLQALTDVQHASSTQIPQKFPHSTPGSAAKFSSVPESAVNNQRVPIITLRRNSSDEHAEYVIADTKNSMVDSHWKKMTELEEPSEMEIKRRRIDVVASERAESPALTFGNLPTLAEPSKLFLGNTAHFNPVSPRRKSLGTDKPNRKLNTEATDDIFGGCRKPTRPTLPQTVPRISKDTTTFAVTDRSVPSGMNVKERLFSSKKTTAKAEDKFTKSAHAMALAEKFRNARQ